MAVPDVFDIDCNLRRPAQIMFGVIALGASPPALFLATCEHTKCKTSLGGIAHEPNEFFFVLVDKAKIKGKSGKTRGVICFALRDLLNTLRAKRPLPGRIVHVSRPTAR